MVIRWIHVNRWIRTSRGLWRGQILVAIVMCLAWGLPVAGQDRTITEGREGPALLEMLQSAVVQIQQAAGRAVVSIKTESRDKRSPQTGQEVPRGETPRRGVGSGVVVDP